MGLAALLGVGLLIGLLAGIGAWVGASSLHLGDAQAQDSSGDNASLYLPTPTRTDKPSPNPLVTQSGGKYPSAGSQPTDKSATSIQLQSVEDRVSPMGHIDLQGSYPGGEGAILQVQRFENGTWSDFNATCSVNGGTFSTWIMTGRSGVNRFRVIDTDTKAVSNAVQVTVS